MLDLWWRVSCAVAGMGRAVTKARGSPEVDMAASIKNIRGRFWDVQRAALELDRFEFIAYFLARMTRTARLQEERGLSYRIAKRRSGWQVLFGAGVVAECDTAWHVFEYVRRTAANCLIQEAEELRIDVHLEQAA